MVDMDTVVGAVYLAIGAFGVVENLLTAFLISGSKEMKNPTYSYIVQSCICDAIMLATIAILTGFMLLIPKMVIDPVCRLGAILVAVGWLPGCIFMVLTALTRWLQLEHPAKLVFYFTTRVIRLTIIVTYVLVASLWTWCLYIKPIPFTFFAAVYTWGYDRSTVWGDSLSYTNISENSLCAILIVLLNARSCWYIHSTRSQVINVSTSRNRQREIKLFIQCAITGTIFFITVVTFFVASSLKEAGYVEYLVTHLILISNHVQQPIVYATMNAGLRRAFVKRFGLDAGCARLNTAYKCCGLTEDSQTQSNDEPAAVAVKQAS